MLTGGIGCGNIMLALNDSANHPSASGGIGRLAGFRCQCSQGRAGSTPASRTNKKDIRKDVLFVLSAEPFCRETSNGESGKYREKVQSRSCAAQWTAGVTDQRCLVMLLSYSY